jgi:hypothetical protein
MMWGALCSSLEGRQQILVGGKILRRKARHAAANVLGVERGQIQGRIAQETPRDRTESHERGTDVFTGLEHRDLGIATPQRILGLHGADGVHGVGPPQGDLRHFGQADRPHLAGSNQIGHRTHALLDRNLLVPAVQVVQVDHVGLQVAQAVFTVTPYGLRTPVDDTLDPVGEAHAGHAPLACERELVAVAAHHLTHQLLVGTEAVQGRGVEQRDTRVECGKQHTLALLRRGRNTIRMAQVHAAQADGRDREWPDLTLLHRCSPRHHCMDETGPDRLGNLAVRRGAPVRSHENQLPS